MSDKRTLNEAAGDIKKLTIDDVYKCVGRWVVWSFVVRTTLRVLSK